MPLGNNVMWTESLCGLVLRLIHLTHAAGGHLVNPPAHIHTWKRRTTPAQHPPHCPIPTCLRISVFIRVVILSPDCVLKSYMEQRNYWEPNLGPWVPDWADLSELCTSTVWKLAGDSTCSQDGVHCPLTTESHHHSCSSAPWDDGTLFQEGRLTNT